MSTEHRPPCVDGNICGESAHCPPAPDERTETVWQVLREHGVRSYDEECFDCTKWVAPHRDHIAAVSTAVVAALDDESARGRASADAWWSEYDRELTAHEATKAEVKRLTRIVNGYDRTPAEQRAASAEAERDAARAALDRVRALAGDRHKHGFATGWHSQVHTVVGWNDLRAALDPEGPR